MKIGDHIEFGKYQWRILDVQHDRALIITEEMVGQRPYHDISGDVTWADCELRKYLNTEFYNQFSTAEKAKIITVINENPKNQWYGTPGGEDTEDHIFLLTIEDVTCKYFGNSSHLLYNPGKNQKYWFQRKDENSRNEYRH